MSEEIRLPGLTIAPSVLDTIITLAVNQVEGVAFASSGQGLGGLVNRAAGKAVEVSSAEDGAVTVSVHITVRYGMPIHTVARTVQEAVADSIRSQVGTKVDSVDVYVDGIEFPQ
ncbi:MAG: Asp23/Gls24 family envelope stress response protein [Clostridiales bacterium]|nr:Asp23/Gls24 family envelope stress response protein [Clostridiales bacterium]